MNIENHLHLCQIFLQDSTFNNVLAELLTHLPNITIKRNTAETIIS